MVQNTRSGWVGWVYFAGVLMVVRGLFELFQGIFSITGGNDFFVATQDQIVLFNLSTWGWLQVVLGILLLTGAASVFSGHFWGRMVGVVMVALSMIANLIWLPTFPIWGIVLVTLDVLMLYALIAHGKEA